MDLGTLEILFEHTTVYVYNFARPRYFREITYGGTVNIPGEGGGIN